MGLIIHAHHGRRRTRQPLACELITHERSAAFHVGSLFYRPNSRIIRDLGVLALCVLQEERAGSSSRLKILDAMSGSGVRSLRYGQEVPGRPWIHSNELMYGDHPLKRNLEALVDVGQVQVTSEDAVDIYMRSRINKDRFDFVDCDAFGTGQPHTAEAWWAVEKNGLLYLCATDSCTTAGHNPHKAISGYAGVAHAMPSSNEQGLRLLLGAAWREAAARNLHATPVFSFFHRPSSSFRVMMRLHKPKRPPAAAYASLGYVGRCQQCGELWQLGSAELGDAIADRKACGCQCLCDGDAGNGNQMASDDVAGAISLSGPLWIGPLHNATFVRQMLEHAEGRGWDDAVALLESFAAEAHAEEGGALLFYHLGEVQRALAARDLPLPPLQKLIALLEEEGFASSGSHSERKALKTSASLEQVVRVVAERWPSSPTTSDADAKPDEPPAEKPQ